jgi:hypothetical protein
VFLKLLNGLLFLGGLITRIIVGVLINGAKIALSQWIWWRKYNSVMVLRRGEHSMSPATHALFILSYSPSDAGEGYTFTYKCVHNMSMEGLERNTAENVDNYQ